MSELTADDFKPGDLAWATVDYKHVNQPVVRVDPLSTSHGWYWAPKDRYLPDSLISDLARVQILPPGTTPRPEGSVTLDPEDREDCVALRNAVRRTGALLNREEARQVLAELAVAQASPVPPEPPTTSLVSDCNGDIWVWDGAWTCVTDRERGSASWESLYRTMGDPIEVFDLRPDTAPTDGGKVEPSDVWTDGDVIEHNDDGTIIGFRHGGSWRGALSYWSDREVDREIGLGTYRVVKQAATGIGCDQ